jgi:anti-anti-sigma factor
MDHIASPRLRTETTHGTTVVQFLDKEIKTVFGEANDLEELGDLLNLLVDQGRHDLVLDFRNVEYMCSGFLHTLWGLQERLADLGGRLRLRGLGPGVLKVFEVTRMYKRFVIERAA